MDRFDHFYRDEVVVAREFYALAIDIDDLWELASGDQFAELSGAALRAAVLEELGAPAEAVAEYFRQGFNTLAEMGPQGVNTAVAQHTPVDGVTLTTAGIQAARAAVLLRQLGRHFKHTQKGNIVIIKGRPGLRGTLTGTRYKVNNPKLVQLGIGPVGEKHLNTRLTLLNLVVYSGINISELLTNPEYKWEEFLGDMTFDLGSIAVSVVLGAAATMLATQLGALGVAAAVVGTAAAPFVVAVGVTLMVGAGISWLDDKFELRQVVKRIIRTGIERSEPYRTAISERADAAGRNFSRSFICGASLRKHCH